MKTYRVRTSCEVAGIWREAGAELTLSDQQAKYLTEPHCSVLEPVISETKEKPDGGFDGNKRKNGAGAD